MRAIVLGETPWSLRVADGWPEPAAGSGQVVVHVRGVGICGSDLALVSGRRQAPAYPWIPGHEATGEIVSAGDGVDPARIGQRVVIEPNYPCLRCPACRAGLTSMCPDRVIAGFTEPGLLAEYVAVPAEFAWPVPDSWTDADAACAEPLTVAQAAIRRSGSDSDGDSLVIGAGSQGALLCLALIARGNPVHVLEPNAGRRQLAVSLGAKAAEPGDAGFPVVFETSGQESAMSEAIGRAAYGATVMLIGLGSHTYRINAELVVRRQLTLRGSMIYDHPADFAGTLSLRGLSPGQVLRAEYPFTEAAAAFLAARDIPGKTWITWAG
ncbi:MAG: alcohol dehydrogenase catalytic domain-containing protein [Streptosporangiaceae bacterium]